MKRLVLLVVMLAGGAAVQGATEMLRDVNPCELMKNPGAYDHALVQVTGLVSHGFEDFSLSHPGGCSEDLHGIWIEYGGTYRKGYGAEGQPVVVEDIHVPLVEDAMFRGFDRVVEEDHSVIFHATLVGRFFAGEEVPLMLDDERAWPRRYGHMSCCSLLVLQQVRAFDPPDRTDVDYDPAASQPQDYRCPRIQWLLRGQTFQDWIVAQRRAELGETWLFNDPRRIAIEALARVAPITSTSGALQEKWMKQGRIVYEWGQSSRRYMVVVSRPYELTFYARDPRRIAWVATSAYEMSCN
jgi:hypothetical protein